MNERTHFFRKIYLSHFILKRVAKGLCVRGELETEIDCNILTPSSSGDSSTSFSFCWAAQPGVTEGHKPSVWRWFSLPRTASRTPTATDPQLTETVGGTGLYNCLTPTCFLWASHLQRIQSVHRSRWYLRQDAPVSRLTAQSKVNILQM